MIRWNRFELLLGLLVCSCSVKEARTDCPCWLSVDLSACASAETDIRLSLWTEEDVYTDSYVPGAVDYLCEYPVRKGSCCISTVVGLDRAVISGRQVVVPEGMPFDPLMADASLIDASGETAAAAVRLYKQYAGVEVDFGALLRDVPGLSVVVRGNVAGMDLTDLSPVPGPFRADIVPDTDGCCRFRVPRQTDDSLQLELWQGGLPVHVYPIGKMIIAQGFDWERPDLGDVRLSLSSWGLSFEVSVSDWTPDAGGTVTI